MPRMGSVVPLRSFGLALALTASVAVIAVPRRARAQEIQLNGPLLLTTEHTDLSYLRWWLRGDGAFAVQRTPPILGRSTTSFEGFAGSVRSRSKLGFAWDFGFAYLRGIENAYARSIPVTARAMWIDARPSRPDWELYLAAGPSYERFAVLGAGVHGNRLGGELAIGVDRKIDPIWNRFLVEVAVAERTSFGGELGRATMVMLRIGIATTFGFRHYD